MRCNIINTIHTREEELAASANQGEQQAQNNNPI
jgi:hypothetical protein